MTTTPIDDRLVEVEKQRLVAEAESLAAAAAKDKAEASVFAAQAQTAALQAKVAQIEWEIADYTHRQAEAGDSRNHVYKFSGPVRAESVASCQDHLSRWARMDPGCDIEIVFNSPGGSVFDGMALFDFLQYIRSEGHHLTTTARGMAASMGGILLQAGDKRVIGAESYVLIHEIATMTGGKLSDIEDEVAFMKRISERVLKIFESRSNLTAAQIKRKWNKKDWWIDSAECLRLGLVDEVR